MTGWDTEKHNT